MATKKQNSVELTSLDHGAINVVVDSAIARLIASKRAVNVRDIAATVRAAIEAGPNGKALSALLGDRKLIADVVYTLGSDAVAAQYAQPGQRMQMRQPRSSTIAGGKLTAHSPRGAYTDGAGVVRAMLAGAKPSSKPSKPAAKRTRKPAAKPVAADATDNG